MNQQKRIIMRHYKIVCDSGILATIGDNIMEWDIIIGEIGVKMVIPNTFPMHHPEFTVQGQTLKHKIGEKVCLGDISPLSGIYEYIMLLITLL
jgi:hypothetical protein